MTVHVPLQHTKFITIRTIMCIGGWVLEKSTLGNSMHNHFRDRSLFPAEARCSNGKPFLFELGLLTTYIALRIQAPTRRYGLGYIHVTMSQCQHSSQLTSMIWGSTCMISYCMQRTNKILLQRTNKILLQRTNMILLQRILLQRTNKILLQRPCCRIHKKL